MNQDLTEKKQHLSEKKISAEGFTWKKNSYTSRKQKKKFVQTENSPPRFWSWLSLFGKLLNELDISE